MMYPDIWRNHAKQLNMMAKAGQARTDPQVSATPGAGPSSQQPQSSHPSQPQSLNSLQQSPPSNTLAVAAAAQHHQAQLAMRNSPSLAQQQQAAMGMNVGVGNMMGGFAGIRPGMNLAPGVQAQQQFAAQQQRDAQQQLQQQQQQQQQQAAAPFGNNASQQQHQPPQLAQPQMQAGQPVQGAPQQPTPQQLVSAAAAQHAQHQLQLNRQLAEQTLENLVRYRDQFHAQRIDLEHKIRALIPQSGPNGAPVMNNVNKEIEDAVRQFRNDLYRCVTMEQTIQKHINVKQG